MGPELLQCVSATYSHSYDTRELATPDAAEPMGTLPVVVHIQHYPTVIKNEVPYSVTIHRSTTSLRHSYKSDYETQSDTLEGNLP